MARELWTVAQAAEAMQCSEDTVRRLIRAGMLPSINVSARLTRLDPDDVAAYIDSRRVRARALRDRQDAGRRRKDNPRGGINNSGYWPGMKVV